MNNPASDIASQILERENQEKQALALLLDRYLARNDQILVQKIEMGGSRAFIWFRHLRMVCPSRALCLPTTLITAEI